MSAVGRVDSLRQRLADERVPAFLACDVANVRYLTGLTGVFDDAANVACVVTGSDMRVFTDGRYGQAVKEAAPDPHFDLTVYPGDIYLNLCKDLTEAGVGTLGLESSMPYGRFRFLSQHFGGSVVAAEQWVEEIRQAKDADEIAAIQKAAALGDRAFDHLLGYIKPGVTEWDLALELEFFMRRNGSEGVAFAPIVASGPDSALPHAGVSHRAVEVGDLLVLDLGARLDGYCSDMTRTVAVGEVSAEARRLYDAVHAAQEAAFAVLRAGVPGIEVDRAARESLERAGLGEAFSHGLGHGVGLEVHELPSLSPRGRASVRVGSVVTIEPGVYVPGFGGVRIEDLVVVVEGGYRALTQSSRDLIVV